MKATRPSRDPAMVVLLRPSGWGSVPCGSEGVEDLARAERGAPELDPERSERIGDGVEDSRRRRDRAALPHALDVQCVARPGLDVPVFDVGHLRRGGEQVVHEAARQRVADLVVDEALVEHAADALYDAAGNLALDDLRVDHLPAVLADD